MAKTKCDRKAIHVTCEPGGGWCKARFDEWEQQLEDQRPAKKAKMRKGLCLFDNSVHLDKQNLAISPRPIDVEHGSLEKRRMHECMSEFISEDTEQSRPTKSNKFK